MPLRLCALLLAVAFSMVVYCMLAGAAANLLSGLSF
jgi:hypothetical protein